METHDFEHGIVYFKQFGAERVTIFNLEGLVRYTDMINDPFSNWQTHYDASAADGFWKLENTVTRGEIINNDQIPLLKQWLKNFSII